ncbi:hypothetical protein [Frisingicoccus sp.]|uniref:hypothetical protein n=1 Tax=Frisingicoccus sp. TaxID=1918627 RepID=UPI00373685CD
MNKENFSLNDEELKEISGGFIDIGPQVSCNKICSKCGGHVYHQAGIVAVYSSGQRDLIGLVYFCEGNGVDQGPHEFSVVGGEEGHCMPAE